MDKCKLLIFGHSIIKKIGFSLTNVDGNYAASLRLAETFAEVKIEGIGGLTITRAKRLVSYKQYFDTDLIYVQIGDNDFKAKESDRRSLAETASEIMEFARMIKELFPRVKRIVLGALLPRFESSKFNLSHEEAEIYRDWANMVNSELLKLAIDFEWIDIWYHNFVFNANSINNFEDGIHFDNIGEKKYIKSLRGAVISNFKKMA